MSSNKVKHFVWKACNNALPTMDNLLRCHITLFATCNVCKIQTKDTLHAIWGCQEVDVVWTNLCWPNKWSLTPIWIFLTSFSGFCRSLKSTKVKFSPSLHGSRGIGVMLYA